jgi:hemerythrin-like domain-containing protein
METKTLPIKRSEQLAPLSREHHDGLLFSWKLRKGLRNETPVQTLRAYCYWYWKNHIKQHFSQEELFLFSHLNPKDDMAARLRKEHDDIRELLLAIDNDPDPIVLGLLADFLDQHIRFEERIVFPHLEQTLSPQQLDDILYQLKGHPVCPARWKEEFWTKKSN